VLLALGVFIDWQGLPSWERRRTLGEICQTVVQPQARLSKQQVAKLLTIPEGSARTTVQAIAKAPYCQLPDLQVRVGATAQREAYALEFDPSSWLIMLYEGKQYAGYRFATR